MPGGFWMKLLETEPGFRLSWGRRKLTWRKLLAGRILKYILFKQVLFIDNLILVLWADGHFSVIFTTLTRCSHQGLICGGPVSKLIIFFSCSAKKKDSDLAAALSRVSGLEGQLNKSEASLATALSQNAALTSELADIKSQLAKVGITKLSVHKHRRTEEIWTEKHEKPSVVNTFY